MPRPSNLDDPAYAGVAWARYRRFLGWTAALGTACTLVTLGWFHLGNPHLSLHFYVATGLGVMATTLLVGALMGLLFLSSGSGHDEAIDDPLEKDVSPDERR